MIKDKEIIKDKETIKETIQETIQGTIQEMIQRHELFPPWIFKDKLVAIGKVDSDGTLLKGTRGITVRLNELTADGFYTVTFPEGLVSSDHYIVQLTAENKTSSEEYWFPTHIGLHYQSRYGFNVSIWGVDDDKQGNVKVPWSFAIYDRKPIIDWPDPRIHL